MRKDGPEKLTLEERIARAARSQAASPETAARLVQRLAQTHTARVFHGNADLELLYGLIGPYMEQVDSGLMHYSGFCRSFWLAIGNGFLLQSQTEPAAVYLPALGIRVNNALVLLGLMLLDHAKGRGRNKDVYHCTRMTLGQYLDALPALAHPGDGTADQQFRLWRDLFLKRADPSTPLAEVLADDLRRYIAGWRVLKRLDHILGCMDGLARYLEAQRTEEMDQVFRETMRQCIAGMGVEAVEVVDEDQRKQYPDPYSHFLRLARAYSADVPDPGAGETDAGTVRAQLFLSRGDYSPAALEEIAAGAPSPEFRALLEEHIDPVQLKHAMVEVNTAVINLFMLWVEPYFRIEERLQ